ncbi:MAG: SMP-30/gluconolactonase/LRE family protein [Nitrospiraceae bacterium]|nr:SMP-30/gluconolactonase/LRE family protein [Nitrospiraceae bacterium]
MKKLIVICALIACAACAPGKAEIDRSLQNGIVWPGVPEKPRIAYLWSLRKVSDSGIGDQAPVQILNRSEHDFNFRDSAESESRVRDSDFLSAPQGVAAADGKLYIADPEAKRINVIDLGGMESSYFYRTGDGDLEYPVAVAAAPGGVIFVSDPQMKKVFAFDEKGNCEFAFEGDFKRPTGLAVDAERKVVYVVDTWAHTIYSYDFSGKRLGRIGRRGDKPGELNFPTYAAVGSDGCIYVADTGNFRVQIFRPDGSFSGAFGKPGDAFDDFDKIKGIALDREGHIYIADSAQDMVKIYDRQGKLLLFFGRKGNNYGDFLMPEGIAIDSKDSIYVADSLNMRIEAFRFLGGR